VPRQSPDAPDAVERIQDFQGLFSESDSHDIPSGASSEQVNCTSEDLGLLQSRTGFAVLTFD